eukprot:1346181-Amorphochlora_amoeboformis.AAC.1
METAIYEEHHPVEGTIGTLQLNIILFNPNYGPIIKALARGIRSSRKSTSKRLGTGLGVLGLGLVG